MWSTPSRLSHSSIRYLTNFWISSLMKHTPSCMITTDGPSLTSWYAVCLRLAHCNTWRTYLWRYLKIGLSSVCRGTYLSWNIWLCICLLGSRHMWCCFWKCLSDGWTPMFWRQRSQRYCMGLKLNRICWLNFWFKRQTMLKNKRYRISSNDAPSKSQRSSCQTWTRLSR